MRSWILLATAGALSLLLGCATVDSGEADTGLSATESIDAVAVSRSTMLAAHNAVRSPLGLTDLTWDDGLAADSELWSKTMAADGCQMYHSAAEGYGENLFWTSATANDQQVVDAWAEEVQWYDYESNSCDEGEQCGHYTQIVWDSTERVGCGAATCPDGGGELWTCRYDPPGNWIGEWPY